MLDAYGRNIDYIRISVTDRCNLRCAYCMPKDGIMLARHDEILSFDEIERLCQIFARLGFKKIKLTGGEPLVRKNLTQLVKDIKTIDGIESVTLTTNGVYLSEYIEDLVNNGLNAVNVSLDSTDRSVFRQITGSDELHRVMAGIEKTLAYGIPVKINCVPLGLEGQNLMKMAEFAREAPVSVRFIEMMPIGLGRQYTFLSESEIMEQMEETYGRMTPVEGVFGNGPCHYYDIEGFQGKIGFISAMSHKFCDGCNRIRLTSQGYLKTCLQYEEGVALRALLRNGSSDSCISEAIRGAVHKKPQGHEFLTEGIEKREQKGMSQIGG